MEPKPHDAIVIGAGLAGLTAAWRLREAGKSVLVLEARDRVGGRTLSRALGADTIDLGAQWIGPGQDRMIRLARELGVKTFPQYSAGRKVVETAERVADYKNFTDAFPLLSQLELKFAVDRIDKAMLEIPCDRPWAAPRAARLDGETLESWKLRNLKLSGGRLFMDGVTLSIFGVEPRELSFLYFLFYLRSGRGLVNLISIDGGAQQDRFEGGAQTISTKLAERLGEAVRLDEPVRAVDRTQPASVRVVTDRAAYAARRVVVAVPPALAARIDFAPALPATRDRLMQSMPMGSVIKCVAAYDRPFWRERGLSGESFSALGPVAITFDDSPPDSQGAARQGALVGFLLGDHARRWSGADPEKRRGAVLDAFGRLFGPEARSPREYVDQDWPAEPWSRGCYAGNMPAGVMTSVGAAIREPSGAIHWAGTETATEWVGYMDGAVESGERASREVLDRLASPS